jgi:hypothetical protein
VIKTKVKITKYLSSFLLLQVYIVVFFIVPNIFRWLTTSKSAHNSTPSTANTYRLKPVQDNNIYICQEECDRARGFGRKVE